jgi:hypothetical protein
MANTRWMLRELHVRKADLDARFPGLIDSIVSADAETVA